MAENHDEHGFEWVAAMVELEEQRGPLVPGGAQGGVIARARRADIRGETPARPSAASRARERVRFLFQAVPSRGDKAA